MKTKLCVCGCGDYLEKRKNDGAAKWEARKYASRRCAEKHRTNGGIVYERKETKAGVGGEYVMPVDFQSLQGFVSSVPERLKRFHLAFMMRGALR
jgi:hypothetical protein